MSPIVGVVTSCPTNLGTGMRASLHIKLPNLTSDGTDAKVRLVQTLESPCARERLTAQRRQQQLP